MAPPDDDDDREAILARRNRFIAAALASLAGASVVAAGCDRTSPKDPDPTNLAEPQPCLKQAPRYVDPSPSSDAAAAAPSDAGAPTVARPDAAPTPCLRVVPKDRAR